MPAPTPGQETRSFGPALFLRLRPPLARRLIQLIPGLVLFGVSISLTIEASLGTSPWTVFHEGASDQLGVSVGTMVSLTGLVLLILFIPLREPFGLGTVLNVIVIGLSADVSLALIPDLASLPVRIITLAIAPPVLGLASGLYIGSGLGPGPRDGLMTAMERRGIKVSVARTIIEVTALTVGWVLGGVVGIGTVYFGVTVGFWVRVFLEPLRIDGQPGADKKPGTASPQSI